MTRVIWISQNTGKTNKRVLDQIRHELIEAKMTKLRLSYFGNVLRRHNSLEKITMLEKECCGKHGRT